MTDERESDKKDKPRHSVMSYHIASLKAREHLRWMMRT